MLSVKSAAQAVLPHSLRQRLREAWVSLNVRQLHGPRTVRLSKDEAIVTCVVKNGEYYMESFIKHYLAMGFRHIFFLDNGSSDQTIAIAREYDNVSVCQSTLPINANQRLFKKYLAATSVRGGWCLDADVDELFDYPHSDVVSLQELLAYLNEHNYSAVMTQLLDMFSDRPLSHLVNEQKEDIKAVYEYYDISEVGRTSYQASPVAMNCAAANRVASNDASLLWGGIRKRLYGNDCLLTKHSLFYPEAGLELFPHIHFVNKANVADVSAVMLHYKLTSNALAMALQNRDNFTENSKTYGAFIDILQSSSEMQVKRPTARRFGNASELCEGGFLMTSPAYEGMASVRAEKDLLKVQH